MKSLLATILIFLSLTGSSQSITAAQFRKSLDSVAGLSRTAITSITNTVKIQQGTITGQAATIVTLSGLIQNNTTAISNQFSYFSPEDFTVVKVRDGKDSFYLKNKAKGFDSVTIYAKLNETKGQVGVNQKAIAALQNNPANDTSSNVAIWSSIKSVQSFAEGVNRQFDRANTRLNQVDVLIRTMQVAIAAIPDYGDDIEIMRLAVANQIQITLQVQDAQKAIEQWKGSNFKF